MPLRLQHTLIQDFGAIPLPFTHVAGPKVMGNGGEFPCSLSGASDGIGVFSLSLPEDPDDIGVYPFPYNGSFQWNRSIPTLNIPEYSPAVYRLLPMVSEYSCTQYLGISKIVDFSLLDTCFAYTHIMQYLINKIALTNCKSILTNVLT